MEPKFKMFKINNRKAFQISILLVLTIYGIYNSFQLNSAFYMNTSEQLYESDWSILISNSTYAEYAIVKDVQSIPQSNDFIVYGNFENETGGFLSIMRFSSERSLLWSHTFNISEHGITSISVSDSRVYFIDSAYNASKVWNVYLSALNLSNGNIILQEKLYDYRIATYSYIVLNPNHNNIVYCLLSLNSSVVFANNNSILEYNLTSKSVAWNYTVPYRDKLQFMGGNPFYDADSNSIYFSTNYMPTLFGESNTSIFKIEAKAGGAVAEKKVPLNSSYKVYVSDMVKSGDKLFLLARNTTNPITDNSLAALIVLDKDLNIIATHYITPSQLDMVVYYLDVGNNGTDVIISAVIEADFFTAPDGYKYDPVAIIQYKLYNNSQNLDLVRSFYIGKENQDMNLMGIQYNETENSVLVYGYMRNYIPENYTGYIIKFSNFILHSPPLNDDSSGDGDGTGNGGVMPAGDGDTKEWTLFIVIFVLGFLIGGSIFYSTSHKGESGKKSKRKSKGLD